MASGSTLAWISSRSGRDGWWLAALGGVAVGPVLAGPLAEPLRFVVQPAQIGCEGLAVAIEECPIHRHRGDWGYSCVASDRPTGAARRATWVACPRVAGQSAVYHGLAVGP
jgi:hypothetical protein